MWTCYTCLHLQLNLADCVKSITFVWKLLCSLCVCEHACVGALLKFSFVFLLNSAPPPTLGCGFMGHGVCVFLGLKRFMREMAFTRREQETHIPKRQDKWRGGVRSKFCGLAWYPWSVSNLLFLPPVFPPLCRTWRCGKGGERKKIGRGI